MKKNWLVEILRIIIAAPIGFWAVGKVHLSTALNILMFFGIYIVVALIIEWVRGVLKKLKTKG